MCVVSSSSLLLLLLYVLPTSGMRAIDCELHVGSDSPVGGVGEGVVSTLERGGDGMSGVQFF